MKGFMRRRGDAWELRVYVGTDPVTGKQRYASRTVRGGKREAQRALNEMVSDAERGLVVRTNATTGELIEAWFEHAAGDFSPKTVKETRGFIDRNLLPAVGAVPLSKLKASDLDRFYRRLLTSGAVGAGGLAPATVRRIHGILRRALAQGVKWGWLGVNPAATTTPPRVPHPEITPPSSTDLTRVLRRASESSPELACFLVLAAATGARRSELMALRWRDVDIADGTVRIERGVVMGPAGLVEKDTKTHAARRVALDERTVQIVTDHSVRMTERAVMCRADLTEDSFVFLRYADGADGARVRSDIDALLQARFPVAETRDRDEVKEQQAGQINQLLYLIYALLGLSVIVSLFGIVNTLALSIFERTRELGLLRAVGTSRRQVRRIVRLESVITSLIGATLGLVLGVLFALAISRPLEEEGFTLSFPVATLAVLLVAAAVAGVLAAIWPARRAAKLDVLESLAYE